MACGIDVGTGNLVAARKDGDKITYTHERNAFIHIGTWAEVKNKLKRTQIPYTRLDEEVYILGTAAYDYANIFGDVELRRPMALGMLNPIEKNALPIMKELLKSILGAPQEENELCVYVTPSEPIDTSSHTVYHEDVIEAIIKSLGFRPMNIKESIALAYAGLVTEDLSGIAVSCLPPGQKVITEQGFKNIEEITPKDKVLSKEGEWQSCLPTNRDYEGDIYTIWSYGNGKITVTENHEIWIQRNNLWQWKKAKEIQLGDLTKQPWRQFNFSSKRIHLLWDEKITCSKTIKTKQIGLTAYMAELLGYFLGDGSLEKKRNEINWTFAAKEKKNIERIKFLVAEIFKKEASENQHGENDIRIKMFSKGFCSWLGENCYNDNLEKIVPWDISLLSDNLLRHFIRGLIYSDGTHIEDTEHIEFTNTSANLAQFMYLALHRLGIKASYNCKLPRKGGILKDGRQIKGTKEVFQIQSSSYEAKALMEWMKNPIPTGPNSYTYGSSIGKIGEIIKEIYKGKVYDLQIIDGDPSFCVPGITVHNCGAGMANTAVVFKGLTALDFSVTKSGDYIDENAAKETNTPVTFITAVKEAKDFTLDPAATGLSREQTAIQSFYRFVIKNILNNIISLFNSSKGMPHFKEPIKIVCGGGTSMAAGFIELFKSEFEALEFPIEIKAFEVVDEPLYAVARGALSEALLEEED